MRYGEACLHDSRRRAGTYEGENAGHDILWRGDHILVTDHDAATGILVGGARMLQGIEEVKHRGAARSDQGLGRAGQIGMTVQDESQ
jgi:hypothetical protein